MLSFLYILELACVLVAQTTLHCGCRYFANVCYHLPAKPGDTADMPTSFYLPSCEQDGRVGSASAFRSMKSFPSICIYTEVVENRQIYISGLVGIAEDLLAASLPESFRTSDTFARYTTTNKRRQMLRRPAIASTTCALGFRRFFQQFKHDSGALTAYCRKRYDLSSDQELVIEMNWYRLQILVMCLDDDVRDTIAKGLSEELDALEQQLRARATEFAVPGTSIRAVMGSGGECKELLLHPMQSICVRVCTTRLSERLSQPIAVLAAERVPTGFFASLAVPETQSINHSEVFASLAALATEDRKSIAEDKIRSIADLREMPVSYVLAAMEYTAGQVCYKVNPFLRACNVEECRKYESYIRALNAFHRLRSQHAANRNRGDTTLFRGCMIEKTQVSIYSQGAQVVWPAFTSTSTDRGVAMLFSGDSTNTHTSVFFEITSPTYCQLLDISAFPSECEVLLPAFSRFTVVSVSNMSVENKRCVCLKHEVGPPPTPAGDLEPVDSWKSLDGCGPVVIPQVSTLEGDLGIVEDLNRHILDIDKFVDGQIKQEAGRIWGRLMFTSVAAATRACQLLNRSIIADVELNVRQQPTETDTLPLQCRVNITMTAIPHNGFANIECGSEEVASKILQSLPAHSGSWRVLYLPTGGMCLVARAIRKDEKQVDPSRLVLKNIPQDYTAHTLQRYLQSAHRELPPNAVRALTRETKASEQEAKELQKLGPDGSRQRLQYLTSLAGDEVEMVDEIRIDRGAEYHCWYRTEESASVATDLIDGKIMPETKLRMLATLECFAEVRFTQKIYAAIGMQVTNCISELHTQLTPHISITTRKLSKRGGVVCIVSGADIARMSMAYRQLVKLQRGCSMKIAVADRPKIFPSQKNRSQRDIVDSMMKALEKKNSCVISPQFQASAIQVIGAELATLSVASDINAFLQSMPFEARMFFPRKIFKKVQQKVSKIDGLQVVVDGPRLVLSSLDRNVLAEARSLASDVVEECDVNSDQTCCVCYEICDVQLDSCGYRLCEDCGTLHVGYAVAECQVPITDPKCGTALLGEDLVRFSDDLSGVYEAGVHSFIVAHRDEYAHCHTPSCPQIFDRTMEAVDCPICLKTQCPKCGEHPHGGEDCETARKKKVRPITEHASHIKEYMLAPACPGCKMAFIDFSNCFAIVCSMCKSGFCGFCLHDCTPEDPHKHTARYLYKAGSL